MKLEKAEFSLGGAFLISCIEGNELHHMIVGPHSTEVAFSPSGPGLGSLDYSNPSSAYARDLANIVSGEGLK